MARLLTPGEYAGLTAFFAVLILEQTGGQVVQAATARLVAQHAAHGDDPALHSFVRRWTTRDRKSTRLNSSHIQKSRMPSSA